MDYLKERSSGEMNAEVRALMEELKASELIRMRQEQDLARLRAELLQRQLQFSDSEENIPLEPSFQDFPCEEEVSGSNEILAETTDCSSEVIVEDVEEPTHVEVDEWLIKPLQELEALKTYKDTLYICFDCNKCFKNESDWKDHLNIHLEDLQLEGAIKAEDSEKVETVLTESRKGELKEVSHFCSLCSKTLSCKAAYRRHMTSAKHLYNVIDRKSRRAVKSSKILRLRQEDKLSQSNFGSSFESSRSSATELSVEEIEVPKSECSDNEVFSNEILQENTKILVKENKISNLRKKRGRPKTINKCSICNRMCQSRYHLIVHENAHRGIRLFPCGECGKTYGSMSNLRKHQRHHSEPVLCEVCGKSFATFLTLRNHSKVHSDEKPFICARCGKSFKWAKNLTFHSAVHSDVKPYVCCYCGKAMRCDQSLKRHEAIHRGEVPHECEICGKEFKNRTSYYYHKRVHRQSDSNNSEVKLADKKHACLTCDKRFLAKSQLVNHEKMHSGQKDFTCLECKKCFMTKAQLTIHRRVHTGEKPYECAVCHKKFAQLSALSIHKNVHLSVKPYECRICGRRFTFQASLNSHLLVHTGEKPYKCEFCGKSFRQSTHLRSHKQVVHKGIKNYICGTCGKAFSSPGNLQQHESTHWPKQEVCEVCCKTFSNKYRLSSHMKTHEIPTSWF